MSSLLFLQFVTSQDATLLIYIRKTIVSPIQRFIHILFCEQKINYMV